MSARDTLLEDADWCKGKGAFPLPAYSEFMPPPRVGRKPYGTFSCPDPFPDPFGWAVSEYEEEQELAPGLHFIARGVLLEMLRLGRGEPTANLSRELLLRNPYWPPELASRAGRLPHEHYVLLLATTLSRTQDDKGRVRWTLFGSSEQGPARAFWRGFWLSPSEEAPASEHEGFFAELLSRGYGLPERFGRNPAAGGVRFLPGGEDGPFPHYDDGPLPSFARELLWRPEQGLRGVKFLLTFRPFSLLPDAVRNAYCEGSLHLWPFPGSLLFWGAPGFRKLAERMPLAMQLSLVALFHRYSELGGIRIPQVGWLHEKVAAPEGDSSHRPHFVRTHRWQKVARSDDDVRLGPMGDRVTRVLFSTDPDDLQLYGKPMARNVQLWTRDYRLVLDGPRHSAARIERAEQQVAAGGRFGYRFVFPAMRVGPYEVYWHRPIVAFAGRDGSHVDDAPLVHSPSGWLTAYRVDGDKPDLARPVELWPRWLDRPAHLAAIELFRQDNQPRRWHTTSNLRALLEWRELLGEPLAPSLASALISAPRGRKLETWLDQLSTRALDPVAGEHLANRLRSDLAEEDPPAQPGLTFDATATRTFEIAYWNTIAGLAHGKYRIKSNADTIRDEATKQALADIGKRQRELDALARHLIREHQQNIHDSEVPEASVGEHRFSWRTDFELRWMGGWLRNQKQANLERNLIIRIPGRDRSRAVILADHYDTAYMHDHYYAAEGGTGARLPAAGADDNHSATAMLLLAAPILLQLSRQGKLGCDLWLVHLTGEEFPSDCLGARHLVSNLVQGTLKIKEVDGPRVDLSGVRIVGVFVADMIAHDNLRNRKVFQIAPGEGKESARLAKLAHETNRDWNATAIALNHRAPRKGARPYRRSDDPARIPDLTLHAILKGEIRPEWDPRSTLFNTDGQIFSDAGIPVVLFMEDYDINRRGYHDSYDTMANIDLDYGSALAAIAIETAVRATNL